MTFILAGYLIWVAGDKGPTPQRCEEKPSPIGTDYWKHRIVRVIELDADDFAQPLDFLAMKYPYDGMAANLPKPEAAEWT